jgi:hypothetical protein
MAWPWHAGFHPLMHVLLISLDSWWLIFFVDVYIFCKTRKRNQMFLFEFYISYQNLLLKKLFLSFQYIEFKRKKMIVPNLCNITFITVSSLEKFSDLAQRYLWQEIWTKLSLWKKFELIFNESSPIYLLQHDSFDQSSLAIETPSSYYFLDCKIIFSQETEWKHVFWLFL